MVANMENAEYFFKKLREGNQRYVSGKNTRNQAPSAQQRQEMAKGQAPFAVILGCSDSRVPAEAIFDQEAGHLFVVRVAGNIVDSSQLGSVEFAVQQLGARLVVVLGHNRCGAVQTALDHLQRSTDIPSPHLRSLIDQILPSVRPFVQDNPNEDSAALLTKAIRANTRASANRLRNDSDILRKYLDDDALLIVGAEYSLEKGTVDFFDGMPNPS